MFQAAKSIVACYAALIVVALANHSRAETGLVAPIIQQVQWSDLLASQDLIWNRLPTGWKQAPFLGNGEQGTMLYQVDRRTLRWDVGCSAAHDHRPFEEDDFNEKNVVVLNRGRHFIGHLKVNLPADLTGGAVRLGLWDAEVTGTLVTAKGKARFSSLVHADQPVMYFEINASGDLSGASFEYVPEQARNPRAVRAKTPRSPANPDPIVEEFAGGVKSAIQNLHSGGQTAVAWV